MADRIMAIDWNAPVRSGAAVWRLKTTIVAIAAGDNHNLLLTEEGTVLATGGNSYGETSVPHNLNKVVAIAAGFAHSIALRQNGTVVAWGNNATGATDVPPGLADVVAISAGAAHSAAVRRDGTVVVWADADPWSGRVIAAARARGVKVMTVGTAGEALTLKSRTPTALGQTLVVTAEGKDFTIALPLIGAYQAANALVSAGLVIACGGAVASTLGHLARVRPVRGRLERAVIARSGAPVYVDYAHTPDALEAAAAALRPHTKGRLILVFGAGGDRDQGKRPLMGAIAVAIADQVIVTDDNPRSEDPALIRAAIMAAAPGATEVADRRSAIAAAIAASGADDVVLIAGKGHEQGQIVGTQVLPFDDVQVARECAA